MRKLIMTVAIAATTYLCMGLKSTTASKINATCVGAKPCKACKNCNYCKRCAKDGGSCGVCKK